jgi:Dyp-type peroxidase family
MASRRTGDKAVRQQVAWILENLSEAEGEVTPQERFSAAGVNFGAEFTPAARAAKPRPAKPRPAAPRTRAAEGSAFAPDETGGAAAAETTAAPAAPAADLADDGEPHFDERLRKRIQGNIIPGFNKDYQHFLFYRLGDLKQAKAWLRWIAPMISSMDEVLAFNRMYRVMRFRLAAKDVPVKATWVNIAFSWAAIAALTSKEEAGRFGEQSFRQGLAERSGYLGDPTDPKAEGNKQRWVIGGPGNEADILVIAAGDHPKLLSEVVGVIKLEGDKHGLKILFEQPGETLPHPLRGHEHFGFKDGISQPGVRGRVSEAPDDYVTPRYIVPEDPRSKLFAKPGQLLVWPGQFVLGMPRQNPESLLDAAAGPPQQNFPQWAEHGSYLVCRRLRQDVQSFWEFVVNTAAELGVPAQRFASMLVGRWPSGSPVMRTPAADDRELGADDLANNHFLFEDDTRPSNLIPIPGYKGDKEDQARADMLGTVCPHFAHIRKVNPRDGSTDLGKVSDSLIRMIIRRGIPFGPPVAGQKKPSAKLLKKERGLMFVCFQSSIEDQFEFLTRRWSNSPIQPNFGGHDPVIGQEGSSATARERFIDFPKDGGFVRVPIKTEWITPTGGGYFFAPPIDAIAEVLGK